MRGPIAGVLCSLVVLGAALLFRGATAIVDASRERGSGAALEVAP